MLSRWSKIILYVFDLPIEQHISVGNEIFIDQKSYLIERELMKCADKIIVFNEKMKSRIQERCELSDDRFVFFEILDYGVEQPDYLDKEYDPPIAVAYAGNLSRKYVGNAFLELPVNEKINYHFFGYDGEWISDLSVKFRYEGYFDPLELAPRMSRIAHYGLILRDLKNPKFTEYHKYGSTSKFSAYMVSGLPVLVPKTYEYIAQITHKYGVGLIFDSPKDLDSLILSVSEDEYRTMRLNAYDLGEKISHGYFFKKAVSRAIDS